jgi:hypothetical protein|tara:strand:+ start:5128 stop:6420 length:1293 start_codon:yes stop_codon:yes gene_type:complete
MYSASNAPANQHAALRRDWVTIIYFIFALGMAMSVSQEYTDEPSSIRYYLFVAPVVIAALCRPLLLMSAVGGKSLLIVIMAFVSSAYFLLIGDISAAMQVTLLGLGTIWFCVDKVCFIERDLTRIYVAAAVVGAIVWMLTDFNRWGLIPGTTDAAYGIWRVSFFSNIAFTAFFSLFLILILTRQGFRQINWRNPILLLAIYFTIFSFVRTALVCLVLYVVSFWLLSKLKRPGEIFLFTLSVTIAANLLIAFSAPIFDLFQNLPVISRLFLRGETQLTEFEIYQQLYRPWLWGEHLKLAWASPNFMGWGNFRFSELVQNSIFDYRLETGDSVSLLTRLLASYGVMGLFYWVFLLVCLRDLAARGDRWGCAIFPVVITAMLQWGSMFHVTDPMALLYTGLVVKGAAFVRMDVPNRLRKRLPTGGHHASVLPR